MVLGCNNKYRRRIALIQYCTTRCNLFVKSTIGWNKYWLACELDRVPELMQMSSYSFQREVHKG